MSNYFTQLSDSLTAIDESQLQPILYQIRKSISKNGTVWIFGNGGSFANAQHWVCDIQKVAKVRSAALGCNGSLLTALSNDIRYEDALAIELRSMCKQNDLLIVLSCSGCSPNVIRLLVAARSSYIPSILLTGLVNNDVAQADIIIRINSSDYGIIEDCHSAIGHWLINELQ